MPAFPSAARQLEVVSQSAVSTQGSFQAYTLSKVASLATETLAHIFILGSAAPAGHPEEQYDSASFPILVSHVCRHWRNVALTTSRLWSRIAVCGPLVLPATSKSDADSSRPECLAETTCLRRIQAFLERSRPSRLTLYVDIRSPSWYSRPNEHDHAFTAEHMSALMDHLLPHIERWDEVEIISDTWAPFVAFLERCSLHDSNGVEFQAKMLRRLALIRCNAYYALENFRFPPMGLDVFVNPFKSAPCLRNVTLAGVHVDWTHNFLKNLTDLSLKYHAREVLPTSFELVNILNSSPNLESLSIHGWGARSFEEDSSVLEDRILITNVKRFSLGWVNAHHFIRLLSLFAWHLPKLESITLEDIENSLYPISEQDSSHILDFISTRLSGNGDRCLQRCSPFELTLNSARASSDSLRRLMEAFPLLHTLTLHNVDDELLVCLLDPLQSRSKDGSPLCPELAHVIVRTAGSIPLVELQQMARSWQVSRHSTISSTQPYNLEIEDLLDSDAEIELSVDVGPDVFGSSHELDLFLDDHEATMYAEGETSSDESPPFTPSAREVYTHYESNISDVTQGARPCLPIVINEAIHGGIRYAPNYDWVGSSRLQE